MPLTSERYEQITGESPPPDFAPCLGMAQAELDARTLGVYATAGELPEPVGKALERFLAYQTQAVSQRGGVAGATEPAMGSASLGKYSYTTTGGSSNGLCDAARIQLPFLESYARSF